MMQGIARYSFDFLASTVPHGSDVFVTVTRVRATPLLPEFGLRFGPALFHGPYPSPDTANASSPSETMPR